MSDPRPLPPTAGADARNRALRTFVQGLLIDLAAALILVVGPSLLGADFAWSRTYWLSLAGLAVKTVLQTGLAYVMRRLAPPPFAAPAQR